MSVQEGDLVMLKSGGAIMTVSRVESSHIEVVWSDSAENFRERYSPRLLRKVELTDL